MISNCLLNVVWGSIKGGVYPWFYSKDVRGVVGSFGDAFICDLVLEKLQFKASDPSTRVICEDPVKSCEIVFVFYFFLMNLEFCGAPCLLDYFKLKYLMSNWNLMLL